MNKLTDTDVIINGKQCTISGYESSEYMHKVASYLNDKYTEFKKQPSYQQLDNEMRNILLQLNIADDYFKAKKQAEMLEEELAEKDKELYDLKHELIGSQIRLETAEKSVADYQKESTEYQKKIVRLETELKEKNN